MSKSIHLPRAAGEEGSRSSFKQQCAKQNVKQCHAVCGAVLQWGLKEETRAEPD